MSEQPADPEGPRPAARAAAAEPDDDLAEATTSAETAALAAQHLQRDTRGAAIMRAEVWHDPLGRVLREIVFGMNDGVISTVAFLAAVSGALELSGPIIASGLAAAISGTLSMAIGGYVSVKSQQEFYESEIRREIHEMATMPEHETEEVRQLYRAKGFRGTELERIVTHITSNRNTWLKVMMEEELGLFPEHETRPWVSAAYVGLSFALGAVVPLLPYFFLPPLVSLVVAIVLSAGTLFGIGAAKARLTHRHWFKSGLEMMGFGVLSALIAYGIGHLVGELVPGLSSMG